MTLALLGARLKLDIRGQQKNAQQCATTPYNEQNTHKIRTHLYLLYLLYQHNLQGPPCCSIPMETRKKMAKFLLTKLLGAKKDGKDFTSCQKDDKIYQVFAVLGF